MAMGEMMGAQPVYEVGGNNDGFGGGGGSWIWIILFILLLGGGNGFGFGNRGDVAGAVDTFALNNIERQIQGLQSGQCASGYETLSNFKDLSAQLADCCCTTNRNIDSVRYENERNTCNIMQNADANTNRIIDHLTQSEMQALRDQLQSANLVLAQANQTTNIINAVRPYPTQCVPFAPYNNFGCNDGCRLV